VTSSKLENSIREAIEGLPASLDPYSPSERSDADTPEPSEKQEGKAPDSEEEPEDLEALSGEVDSLLEPPKPQRPSWRALTEMPGAWSKMTNAKDQMYERSDGFVLRFRPLVSVPNRFLAQIIRGDEVLEKGFVDVPMGIDPKSYLQKMSDTMLDAKSERYAPEEPDQNEGLYASQKSGTTPSVGEVEGPPEEQMGGESDEMDMSDLGLDILPAE